MLSSIKKIIFWSYERASWQWDLLCFLIILFIFLTPKQWFEKPEATRVSRVIVKQKDFSPDKSELARRVKELSGNPEAEILEWHEKRNADGEIFYEIDIR
jgi:hypothetical protein